MHDDETYEGEIVGPVVPLDHVLEISRVADDRVRAMKRIMAAALKLTNSGDWCNMGGKPYLEATGAEKLIKAFGINIHKTAGPIYEEYPDGHFEYRYEGMVSFGPVEIDCQGIRSSKGFFTKKGDTEVPPSEVNRGHIKQAAWTNLEVNGISRILGLRNLTWEELAAAGIDTSRIAEVTYSVGDEAGSGYRDKLWKMLCEMVDGDEKEASRLLGDYSSFKGKKGEKIYCTDINKMKPGWAKSTYFKVKKDYDKAIGSGEEEKVEPHQD